MIYSQACGYCLTALCRLRLMSARGPVRVAELCRLRDADHDDLPAKFVAKIFQDLVRSGILSSTRGRNGGFIFARPPAKIRITDIVEAVDGPGGCRACVSGMPLCNEKQPCPLHDRFQPVRRQILQFLQETTLESLSESLAAKMSTLGVCLPCEGVPDADAAKAAKPAGRTAAKTAGKMAEKPAKRSLSLRQVPPAPRARKG